MPKDPAKLWNAIYGLIESERLALLAHCVSLSVNAVRHRMVEEPDHADVLARELALDMTAYWQPTAASYLGRVSKERILEAVSEGVSPDAVKNLSGMKKGAMAAAAEKILAGKGWLPSLLGVRAKD